MPEHTLGPTPRIPSVTPQPPAAAWSVWPTGEHDETTQLHTHGYLRATTTDAERIPPAVAAYTISSYSRSADTVLDPDCGAGTVLVEALRAGRHAVGLTTSDRWWSIARANLTTTKRAGAWPDASVLDAHPCMLTTARAAGLTGRIGLVLTTLRHPQPNSDHHGRTEPHPHETDPALPRLAQTLTACVPLLRPGAHVIITIRRRRRHGVLQDLPSAVLAAGHTAGLIPLHRCIALTAPLRGTRLALRAVTWRQARAHVPAGSVPVSLVTHHDVLIFGAPDLTEQPDAARDTPTLARLTPIRWPAQGIGEDIRPNGRHSTRHAA
ncbi:MAG: DNA methylase [Pseudonocardiales bacterium]|nr:DNA methylase [Pseudonocardiales bacterium]